MPILQRFSGVIWWFGKGMYGWVEVSGREIIAKYCLIKAFIYHYLLLRFDNFRFRREPLLSMKDLNSGFLIFYGP